MSDWWGALIIAALAAAAVCGCALVSRRADRRMDLLRRRHGDPQAVSAPGTGVECKPPASAAAPSDVDALPRSPMAPVAGDPRPSATGLVLPAATVEVPHAVAAGLHRRPVVIHDW